MLQPSQKIENKLLPPEKLNVLDICQRIHKLAEAFYLSLAELHRDQHRETAKIWGLLAIDKCNHAEAFRMASRLRGQGIKAIDLSVETAQRFLEKMKTIPKVGGSAGPLLLEYMRFAIKMEEKLNTVHFRHVVTYCREQDMELMSSTFKSSGSIVHILSEEYVNLTLLN